MKKGLITLIMICLSVMGNSQYFQNPILAGFYPDPSICRAGDDYYLINSSFAYYPGIPIFHSKDLLNWEQIGHAMDRPEQLNLDSAGVSRGLFAPAISYHDGLFYIVCTEVSRLGNFIITAKDPRGPWSNPVKLPEVNGIDPSLFFDEDKAYIVFNSIPPGNITKWNGHRTIRMFEFDAANLKVKGAEQILINGGTDTAKHPVWIEGPHLLKKDGWYYLLCAEGGTGYNHSEVVFRSKTMDGPFIPGEKNPILTQRQLDPNRPDPITTTGHADFVDDKKGNWWAVFLGCRPYEGDYYNTGRETFMAPVVWQNGWPDFNLGGELVKYQYPIDAKRKTTAASWNGNFTFIDEFSAAALSNRYCFLRTVRDSWYDLTTNPGSLRLQLRSETCSGKGNPSFVGFRQPHLEGEAITALDFTSKAENEKAGLLLFQNEKNHYLLCRGQMDGKQVLQLYRSDSLVKWIPVPADSKGPLLLKIQAKKNEYAFWYAGANKKWKLFADHVDAKWLSTKTAGGFVGCIYAMYASSNGVSSDNQALFQWFVCRNNDKVYQTNKK